MLQYAMLNGLHPEIATYVTQQPADMEALLEPAKVAELTGAIRVGGRTLITTQLGDVKAELSKMGERFDKLTAAATIQPQQQTNNSPQRGAPCTRGRGRWMNRGYRGTRESTYTPRQPRWTAQSLVYCNNSQPVQPVSYTHLTLPTKRIV